MATHARREWRPSSKALVAYHVPEWLQFEVARLLRGRGYAADGYNGVVATDAGEALLAEAVEVAKTTAIGR